MAVDLFRQVQISHIVSYERICLFLVHRNVFLTRHIGHHAVVFIRICRNLNRFLGRFRGISEHALQKIRML